MHPADRAYDQAIQAAMRELEQATEAARASYLQKCRAALDELKQAGLPAGRG